MVACFCFFTSIEFHVCVCVLRVRRQRRPSRHHRVVRLAPTGDATVSVGAARLSEFLNIGYDQQVGARVDSGLRVTLQQLCQCHYYMGDPSHLGQKYSSKGRRQQRERFVSWPFGRKSCHVFSRLTGWKGCV